MTWKNIIIKASLGLMLINLYVFTVVFKFAIPHCTQITTVIAIAYIACYSAFGHNRFINKAFIGLYPSVLYFIFLLFSGIIISLYTSFNLTNTLDYFEMIVFGIIVCFICWSDQSYEFVYILCMIIAAIDAIYSIATTSDYYTRIILANNVSENIAGMLFFCGAISTILTKNKYINNYIRLFLNILYVFAIVLTGSRQALLLCGIVYLYWILPFLKRRIIRRIKISKIFFAFVVIGLVILFFRSSLIDIFLSTKLYARLIGTNTSTAVSDATRVDLYRRGLETMWSSPVWGAGYKNHVYTHSTYMEVLAGSGLMGTIIFFFPILKKAVYYLRRKKRTTTIIEYNYFREKLMILLALLFMMAFRAVHYYMPSFMLLIIGVTCFDYPKCLEEQ